MDNGMIVLAVVWIALFAYDFWNKKRLEKILKKSFDDVNFPDNVATQIIELRRELIELRFLIRTLIRKEIEELKKQIIHEED